MHLIKLNPKDPDILNLKGLLYLLKCDFSKAFESFYTSQCYGNNELSRKYVNLLSSKDFKVFLERYNHSIRFINEELNEEYIIPGAFDDRVAKVVAKAVADEAHKLGITK